MISKINYIESNTTNPYFNLALEEELFDHCSKEQVILYLWKNSNTVVIGKNQNVWSECNVTKLEEDAVTLVRRMSGGGAVFHDVGNLNFTFICHKENYDVDKQLSVIISALEAYGIKAQKSGRNDVLADGKKFSGNAFYERGERCYHHGTLMLDVDITKLSKYLTVPESKIKSKGIDSVQSRVINLTDIEPSISIEGLKQRLREAFEATYEMTSEILYPAERSKVHIKRQIEKYMSWEWNFGRAIDFQYEIANRFSWGCVTMQIAVDRGSIKDVEIFSDAMYPFIGEALKKRLTGIKYTKDRMLSALKGFEKHGSIYTVDEAQMAGDITHWLKGVEL